MACYPWIVPHQAHGQNLDDFPNLKRWFEAIRERPATRRAYAEVKDAYSSAARNISAESRQILFGNSTKHAN